MGKQRLKACAAGVLLGLAGCPLPFAQEAPAARAAHDFFVRAEYSRTVMLDHLASPNVIAGNGVVLDAGYLRDSTRTRFAVNLEGSWADLERYRRGRTILAQTGYDSVGIPVAGLHERHRSMIGGRIRIQVLFNLIGQARLSDGLKMALGFELEELAQFPISHTMHGLVNVLALNLAARASYRIGQRNILEGAISFPAVGAVTRLPWSTDPEMPGERLWISFFRNGTQIATVNTLQHVQAALSWAFRVSPALSLVTGYRFEWLHYSLPRHITTAGNRFYVGVNL
jgi:hypothetical protein